MTHPAIHAVRREIRALMGTYQLPPLCYSSGATLSREAMTPREKTVVATPMFRSVESVHRLLRVEMVEDAMYELIGGMGITIGHFYAEREGPFRVEGVDYYLIEPPGTLPAPGWRVINPFGPKA